MINLIREWAPWFVTAYVCSILLLLIAAVWTADKNHQEPP